MSKDRKEYLTKRGGIWYYYRRIPKAYLGLQERSDDSTKRTAQHILISTDVRVADDRTGIKAGRAAAKINEVQEATWRGLLEGKTVDGRAANDDGKKAYADAIKRARALGFDYLHHNQVVNLPNEALLARIETLLADNRQDDSTTCGAVLGLVDTPRIMLSDLFDEFEKISAVEIAGKSEEQRTKWEKAHRRAVEIFIEQHGEDKAVQTLTRADMLGYVAYWRDRILNDEVTADSANRNLTPICSMIRAVNRHLQLGLDEAILSGLRFPKNDAHRSPIPVEHIRDVILAPGALDGLDKARDIVHVLIETGCRLSEIANIKRSRIVLNADVPHIKIAPDGRELKNKNSERQIPLVGIALEAMKRNPNGFPMFAGKSNDLSKKLGTYFHKNELFPTDDSEKHYATHSYRHSFKDRLKAVECPEEMIDELLGHANRKPKYGDGYGLKLKHKFLKEIAINRDNRCMAAAA